MELFDRVLNKSPVFISYFNKYFVDNFDESIANINVKLYCQTFLVLLSLMLNIHLFPWHINTATFLAENNIDQHTAGRLAILNADLHTMCFPLIPWLFWKFLSLKKNPVCWCYKHTVFFFYNLSWKKNPNYTPYRQQRHYKVILAKNQISSNSIILIPKRGYWQWLDIIKVTFEKRI